MSSNVAGKRSRTILGAVLALVLAAGAGAAETAQVKEGGAWLREGSGVGYGFVGRLKEGETVEVLEREDGWMRVRRPGGIEGWLQGSFLEGATASEGPRPAEAKEAPEAPPAPRKAAPEPQREQAERRKARRERKARSRKKEGAAGGEAEAPATVEPAPQERAAVSAPEGSAVPPQEAGETGAKYQPMDMDRILDQVVSGIYESGPVGPGMDRPGPPPPVVPPAARRAPKKGGVPEEKPEEGVERQEPESLLALRREPSAPADSRKWASLPPPTAGARILEEIVARVNDEVITKSELDDRLRVLDKLSDSLGLEGERAEDVRANLLPRLVDEKLLLSRAEKLGVDREKVYQAAKRYFMQQYGIKSDMELLAFLDQSGLDMGDFRSMVLRNYVPALIIEKEVRGAVRIPPDEMRRYYQEHQEEFRQPERVHLREIVILRRPGESKEDLRRRLVSVLSRIEGGEDFAGVAREVSQAPSAEKGGDLGEIGRGVLAPEMEDRAFSLVKGEMGVQETDYGYHILRLEDRQEAKLLRLDEVEDRIRERLEGKHFQEGLQAYLKRLRSQAFIEIAPKYLGKYGTMED